jgi:pimeloyl-ACP methyl ester carboxylesterase
MKRWVSIVLGAAFLLGCNVVRCQRERYEAVLHQAALEPRTVRLGPDQVHFWEGGHGPPVVLVHGFGADAIWQWHAQVKALAPGHRLLVPDLLWFGHSSSSVAGDFSIGRQVEMLRRLALDQRVARADWVGISYGGLVVYELSRRYPALARRMVLIDSPGDVYAASDYRALCQRFEVDHIGRVLVPDDIAGVRRLQRLAYHHPPWTPDFAAAQVLRELYGQGRREKLALLDGLLQKLPDRAPPGPRPTLPTLILWGDDDPVFPVELGRKLARELGPTARMHVIAHARHAPNLEHPDEVNRFLLDFLAR